MIQRKTVEKHSLDLLVPKEVNWEIVLFEIEGISVILSAGRFERYEY